MSWIDFLSALVGIVTGLLTIVEKYKNYIKSKKDSKKDPSDAGKQADGHCDDIK